MNILFFTRRFYPHIGGVEKHILELSKELILQGHAITVITEDHTHSFTTIKAKVIQGINVCYVPLGKDNWFKKFRIWYSLIKNRNIFEHADIIHIHDIVFWYAPLSWYLRDIPTFVTHHGYEGKYPISLKSKTIRRLTKYLVDGSIEIGAYVGKWYGTHPDYVLYGGVSQSELENAKKSVKKMVSLKNNNQYSPLQISLIGRLEKDIGIYTYLQFFKELTMKKIPYTLTVLGDGPMKSALSKYGVVKGFVDDVIPYIQNADIICTSSYLSIHEALLFHKRIFSVYENPLKKDYLEMTPFKKWLTISNNPCDFVDFIKNLKSPKRTKSEINEIDAYLHNSTWKTIARTYEDLWKK